MPADLKALRGMAAEQVRSNGVHQIDVHTFASATTQT